MLVGMTQTENALDQIINDDLDKARKMALEGTPVFVVPLINAKDIASKRGVDISAQAAEIEKTGYTSIVRQNLLLARERADAGDTGFEILLESAHYYAAEAKMDISKDVVEIRQLYHNGRQAK